MKSDIVFILFYFFFKFCKIRFKVRCLMITPNFHWIIKKKKKKKTESVSMGRILLPINLNYVNQGKINPRISYINLYRKIVKEVREI